MTPPDAVLASFAVQLDVAELGLAVTPPWLVVGLVAVQLCVAGEGEAVTACAVVGVGLVQLWVALAGAAVIPPSATERARTAQVWIADPGWPDWGAAPALRGRKGNSRLLIDDPLPLRRH